MRGLQSSFSNFQGPGNVAAVTMVLLYFALQRQLAAPTNEQLNPFVLLGTWSLDWRIVDPVPTRHKPSQGPETTGCDLVVSQCDARLFLWDHDLVKVVSNFVPCSTYMLPFLVQRALHNIPFSASWPSWFPLVGVCPG
ncbi:unnamed protein product [Timema podura]|uniref:Uncharacterized protein n=1 Tax=Timema podura TaxID=61482 RepID=A0ABN7P2V7_TIMPD|nr:unnamed protein product [Timema podura]